MCPYDENGLETEEEHQAWHILMVTLSQMRTRTMGGVLGFDHAAIALAADAFGYDKKSTYDLITDAEPTVVRVINDSMEKA